MKRILIVLAVVAGTACDQTIEGPSAPRTMAPGAVHAEQIPGVTTFITSDSLFNSAIAQVVATQSAAAGQAITDQRAALITLYSAALKAGDSAAVNTYRLQIKALTLNTIVNTFGVPFVATVQASVDAALLDVRAKIVAASTAGMNISQPYALYVQATAYIADAKTATFPPDPCHVLDMTLEAGSAIMSIRKLLAAAPPPPPPGLWATIEAPRAWDYVPTYPSQSACNGAGTTYDVGAGFTYIKLAQVPWQSLLPCDVVQIHWQTNPYREMVLLTNRGAANKFIRITGIPGPGGALPVIDGAGATSAPGQPFINPILEGLGLFVISPPAKYTYGYKPGYIEISNLELRNARMTNSYVNGAGQTVAWQKFGSGVYIERAENVTIRNCHIHDNGLGIMQNSKFDEAAQSRYLLVQSNYVHDNGNPWSASEHNAYTEGVGTVYEYNWFGPLLPQSYGDNIKERSAGVTFRYNRIESGVHLIALRDPQSNANWERVQRDAWGALLVNSAYVYGNLMIMRENPVYSTNWGNTLIGFGDGNVSYGNVRQGTLYFYNNTVVSQADYDFWHAKAAPLFEVINVANNPVVQARNNVFYATSKTAGAQIEPLGLFYHYGNADFSNNWITAGYVNVVAPASTGGILDPLDPWNGSGLSNTLNNAANNPGFTSFALGNYLPAPGSPLIGAGAALDPQIAVTGNLPTREYVHPQSSKPRNALTSLGAFEP
jgi:hypothetical protein